MPLNRMQKLLHISYGFVKLAWDVIYSVQLCVIAALLHLDIS